MTRAAPVLGRSQLAPARSPIAMSSSLGFGLAVFGVLCIGLAAVTAAVSEVGPIASAFWRMALAAPVLGALVALRPGAWDRIGRLAVGPMPVLAAAAFAATLILWYEGQRLSSVASTSALHNLAPIVVLLVVCCRTRTGPRLDLAAGLVLALVGAGGLAAISASISDRALAGDLLAAAAAVTLAFYYMAVTRLCRAANAWEVMFLVCALAAPLLWVAARAQGAPVAPVTLQGWGLVLLLAIAGQVGGQAALAAASRRLGALGTSAVALGEPGTAALLAILLTGAPFLPVQFVCIGVLCAGIWMCQASRAEMQSGAESGAESGVRSGARSEARSARDPHPTVAE